MRALNILCEELKGRLGFLHAKTHAAFWRGVVGVACAGQLWLTALGRGMPGDSVDKHRIKAADRLLGNANLQLHLVEIYRVLTAYLVEGLERPRISVDWTGVGSRHYALTASLSYRGRSLPILSRVHPRRTKGNPKAEREFLQHLAQVVPSNCRPILITDAGFHSGWFEQVRALGWDFVGRLRGTMYVCINKVWQPLTEIHPLAKVRPLDLGVISMVKKKPREFRVVLSKRHKSKGRKRLTLRGTPRRDTTSKKAIQGAREPWVLATSLGVSPKKIVELYALRMQIEECFRDLKAHRHGWSLDHVCSRAERIEILMLLAAVAMVGMHAIGTAVEGAKLHFGYQANTVRNRRVFSTFFLARLFIRNEHSPGLAPDQIRNAFAFLRASLREASGAA